MKLKLLSLKISIAFLSLLLNIDSNAVCGISGAHIFVQGIQITTVNTFTFHYHSYFSINSGDSVRIILEPDGCDPSWSGCIFNGTSILPAFNGNIDVTFFPTQGMYSFIMT